MLRRTLHALSILPVIWSQLIAVYFSVWLGVLNIDMTTSFPEGREDFDYRPGFGPLDRNPCANTIVAKSWACANPGNLACSACKLVSYCSKECQKAHWKRHKKTCNAEIRTDAWRPLWERESRPPSFLEFSPNITDDVDIPDSPLSLGMSLWGNTPSIDLINFRGNETDVEKNLNLAFIASGDFRHAMKTINALPTEYNGRLNILINDINPLVAARNLALLLILGQITDEALAADVALHFWYSILMPSEYKLKLSGVLGKYIDCTQSSNVDEFALSPSSSISGQLTGEVTRCLKNMTVFEAGEAELAQAEYSRVRDHSTRKDLRDRMYSRLRPSHRLAFLEYRRFGVVLPFGAFNAHFDAQNRSLFSFAGQWMQTDYADPLEGWDVNEVVEAGRDHGANAEDIYGCLYFFISGHLRTLWKRLRTLKISFTMTNMEARMLALAVKTGRLLSVGVSPTSGFDRIHVSNILDTRYVGLKGVLDSWSSLLSVSKNAAIVGYFMNWVGSQTGGRVMDLTQEELGSLSDRMVNEGKVKFPDDNGQGSFTGFKLVPQMTRIFHDFQNAISFMMSNIDFIYDNSVPFSTFLQKQGLGSLLKKHGLKLRKKYTIVPQRIGTTIGGASSDLPRFDGEDSWYYQSSMLSSTGFERFVEFACV